MNFTKGTIAKIMCFAFATQNMSAERIPSIWHHPDSLIVLPQEDSIAWTDEYTVFAVTRSAYKDSTECLWSFAEDDTVSMAVLTNGMYLSGSGILKTQLTRDFSRWSVYAYHSGLRLDSTKRSSLRLGSQAIYPRDSISVDSLSARIEMEELAFFAGRVSRLADAQFQTYLALKYGITLDYAAYIAQSGDTLWHPEEDDAYYHRIIGLGHDTLHGWNANLSQSKENASFILRCDSLSSGEYVVMGDDGGDMGWHEQPDSTYSVSCIWRIRQHVAHPKPMTIILRLHELESYAGLPWIIVSDANDVPLQTQHADSIVSDSLCYFSLSRVEHVMHIHLYGYPKQSLVHEIDNSYRLLSTTNDSNANIWYNADSNTIYVDGYPEGQVFLLYLYDGLGRYISSVTCTNPININMLPSAVYNIGILVDNVLIGTVGVPVSRM